MNSNKLRTRLKNTSGESKYILKKTFYILLQTFALSSLFNILMSLQFPVNVIDNIIEKEVPFNIIIKLIILKLIYILPASILFGMALFIIILTNEIIAMKRFNFSMIIPVFITVGLLLYMTTFTRDEKMFQWPLHQAENIEREILYKKEGSLSSFFYQSKSQLFFVKIRNYRTKKMKNIMIFDGSERNSLKIIKAKRAVYKNEYWKLINVTVNEYIRDHKFIKSKTFSEFKFKTDILRERYPECGCNHSYEHISLQDHFDEYLKKQYENFRYFCKI